MDDEVRRLVVAREPAGLAVVFLLDRLAAGLRVVLGADAGLPVAAGLAADAGDAVAADLAAAGLSAAAGLAVAAGLAAAAAGFAAAAAGFAAALVVRVAGLAAVALVVVDFAAVFRLATGLRVVFLTVGLAVDGVVTPDATGAAAEAPVATTAGVAAAGFVAADFAADDLAAVERFTAGFRVVLRTAGLGVVDPAGTAVGLAAVLLAAAALLAAAVFDAGVRRRAGLRAVVDVLAAGAVRPGVTAVAARPAAAVTLFAAPPIASPTVLTAEPTLDAASEAIRVAKAATSAPASSACLRRLASSLAPFGPWAAAIWRSRFDSVLRADARRFSSFLSSFSAALGSGVTTPFASTTTPDTVSMTMPARPLVDSDSSPLMAIDGPPLWGRVGRDGPSPETKSATFRKPASASPCNEPAD